MSTVELTLKRGYPIPVPTNELADDVDTLRLAMDMVDGDIDALMTAMSGKAAAIHPHVIGDIDGLTGALASKSDAGHEHSLGELSNVLAAVDSAAQGSVLVRLSGGWGAGNPASILGAHQHIIGNVEGLQLALDAKLDAASLPAAFSGAPTKGTPVDADSVLITDSAAGDGLKRTLWSNIKSTLKSYFDGLYATAGHSHSAATTGANGFMSSSDKAKLDAVKSMANRNVTISTAAPSGGADGDLWFQYAP